MFLSVYDVRSSRCAVKIGHYRSGGGRTAQDGVGLCVVCPVRRNVVRATEEVILICWPLRKKELEEEIVCHVICKGVVVENQRGNYPGN